MQIDGLHQVALHADDLDRAASFWASLGAREMARFDPPGLVFFELGATRLLLEQGAPASLLYLRVPDIDTAWADVATAGGEQVSEPHPIHRDEDGTFGPKGNEEWMAFFKDSEGNLVGLVEQRLLD